MLTNYGAGPRQEILLYPRQFLLQPLMNCKAHRLLYIQKKVREYFQLQFDNLQYPPESFRLHSKWAG